MLLVVPCVCVTVTVCYSDSVLQLQCVTVTVCLHMAADGTAYKQGAPASAVCVLAEAHMSSLCLRMETKQKKRQGTNGKRQHLERVSDEICLESATRESLIS
jgi:hypothetical protein